MQQAARAQMDKLEELKVGGKEKERIRARGGRYAREHGLLTLGEGTKRAGRDRGVG